MLLAAFCLACGAMIVALFALVAALDAREFWRALLDDYRRAQPGDALRDRGPVPFPRSRPYTS